MQLSLPHLTHHPAHAPGFGTRHQEVEVRGKPWLLATRHTVRDDFATVVLVECLGEAGATAAFRDCDEIYQQASGISPLAEVIERLASATPGDRDKVDLTHDRGIEPPWNNGHHLRERGRHWARRLTELVLGSSP